MANRHLSRSVALQSLFEWDFNDQSDNWEEIVSRNVTEFAPGLDELDFAKQLVSAVIKQQAKLDLIISKAAPEWPMAQIAIVDRNVLRLGLYELLFADKQEVPARVAINEAIELAKTFGGENSGKFVNGVLGAIYKELGEPGKNDVPAKKRFPKDIPYDQMPVQKLGGAVVYARTSDGGIHLALVHDIFGYWTLSKGKIEPEEEVRSGAVREIKEEMGLDITVEEDLGNNEYISSDPEQGKIRKQVHYFLASADFTPPHLGPSGGLDQAKWFRLEEIADLRMYDDVVPFITKAIKLLSAGQTATV